MSRSRSLSSYNGGGGSPGPGPGPYAAYAQHGYPQLLVYPAQELPQQTLQRGRGVSGHEEIILVSDDRVLTLCMALPGQ